MEDETLIHDSSDDKLQIERARGTEELVNIGPIREDCTTPFYR